MSTHEAERAAKEAIDRHFHDAYVRGHADGRAEVLKRIFGGCEDPFGIEAGPDHLACIGCGHEVFKWGEWNPIDPANHAPDCLWLEAQQATKAPTT